MAKKYQLDINEDMTAFSLKQIKEVIELDHDRELKSIGPAHRKKSRIDVVLHVLSLIYLEERMPSGRIRISPAVTKNTIIQSIEMLKEMKEGAKQAVCEESAKGREAEVKALDDEEEFWKRKQAENQKNIERLEKLSES